MTADLDLMKFLQERDAALIALDMNWARKQIRAAHPGRPDPSYHVLLAGMHKARYACTTLPDEVRHESRKWLATRGLGSHTGPLLPEGELPK